MPFQVSWSASLGPGWFLEAYGSDGRLEMRAPSFPTPNETSLKAGKLGGAMEEVDLAQFKSSGFSPEFQPQAASTMAVSMTNMVASIEGKARAHPDFEQAWQIERIQEAIRISWQSKRWVSMAEVL